ncbi:hypothetical protein [Lederbergia galactosidilytica]|uniref:NADH dehydrogenase subunit 4 n=1 Tax=Lederbergia galactosidilytica TaxID=217031 RepID=A0A0Q9XM30_9BACI|nr:hypothetical protein [Lederbergia galactosidilytica]KRG09420.1 hypothetical protein ACA29_24000 [Lederbergia galactosidilytica]KRG16184.1 hypothetical protein ACA30_02620 [Virgibacillus soli]MBP1914052.1 preprotein translocase subunit SecE [Lederbergia galactosidilytica]OAK75614.1 hypothetical protein ABB05_01265 [Lederbergia galactosidilytica]
MQNNMTLKDWIITMILLVLPIVNIVMLIIWAVDKEEPRNLFAKAYLIVMAGTFAVVIIFYILMLIIIFAFSAAFAY